jgi:hypothetical protein
MQISEQPWPTCGALIRRVFKKEVCAEPAVHVLTLLDLDDRTIIKGVLLACKKHSKDLEMGKKLIFVAEGKDDVPTERIAVKYIRRR